MANIKGLVVVFNHDLSEVEASRISQAVQLISGVQAVEVVETTATDILDRLRIVQDLRIRINNVFHSYNP